MKRLTKTSFHGMSPERTLRLSVVMEAGHSRAFQVGPIYKLKKNDLPYGIIIISITGGHLL